MKKGKISQVNIIQNSGGRSSAYMTEMLLRRPDVRDNCIILFQNTGREANETLDFIHKCETRWLSLYNRHITWLEYNPFNPLLFDIVTYATAHRINDAKPSPFELLIKRKGYLPHFHNRFCTSELKVRTAKRYIQSLGYTRWNSFIGIRADEKERAEKMETGSIKQRWFVQMPMVNDGITKEIVNSFWKSMPFDLNIQPHMGNCDLCFLKGKGKKRHIIRENAMAADWWLQMEKETGRTFKDYSIQSLIDTMNTAPEIEFREDYECDVKCACNID